jgi:hypothetical protein
MKDIEYNVGTLKAGTIVTPIELTEVDVLFLRPDGMFCITIDDRDNIKISDDVFKDPNIAEFISEEEISESEIRQGWGPAFQYS